MKKALVITLVLALGLLTTSAFAFQTNSFTYQATAGMFEDMYDYFTYSPAYITTFNKNVLWSQLANQETQTDRIFGNAATSSYYMLGGQMDTGFGRGGLLFDWSSTVTPGNSTYYGASAPHSGFGEGTNETYKDRNSDGIMDYREETYGRSNNTSYSSAENIYLVYGLGALNIFDLGLGVKANLSGNQPTYDTNHSLGTNSVAQGKDAFNIQSWDNQYDLVTGQPIYTMNESTSGSLSTSQTNLGAILGVRTEKLIPGLTLLCNIAPSLNTVGNSYSYNYSRTDNFAPADPAFQNTQTQTVGVSGVDSSYTLPSTGFGVEADVRADYQLNPGVLLTGWANVNNSAFKAGNVSSDQTNGNDQRYPYWTGTQNVQAENNMNVDDHYIYDQKGGDTTASLRLRAQFPAKGWRLGMGVNAKVENYNYDTTTTYTSTQTTRYTQNDGNLANSYTDTLTAGDKQDVKYEQVTDTLEFPVGLIIDLLSNLNLQLGAKHTVTFVSTNNTTVMQDQTLETDNRVYDNGVQTNSAATPQTAAIASGTSTYSVSHTNALYYGLTWLPYPQVQIDVMGFQYIEYLNYYYVSVNLYF